MVQREKHSHFGGSAFFCRNDRGKPANTARRVPAFLRKTKRIVRKQNSFRTVCPKRLLQLSAAGEVFLEGEQPSESLSADSEIPAPCFWRTGKVGEKSDSFSRAERTRPLRPVCRLLLCDFGNVPVERFQRDFPLPKSTDTAQPVPTGNDRKSIVQEQKDEEYKPPLKGEVGGKAARRGQFRCKIKTKKNCNVRTPQSVLRTASSPFRGALLPLSFC